MRDKQDVKCSSPSPQAPLSACMPPASSALFNWPRIQPFARPSSQRANRGGGGEHDVACPFCVCLSARVLAPISSITAPDARKAFLNCFQTRSNKYSPLSSHLLCPSCLPTRNLSLPLGGRAKPLTQCLNLTRRLHPAHQATYEARKERKQLQYSISHPMHSKTQKEPVQAPAHRQPMAQIPRTDPHRLHRLLGLRRRDLRRKDLA